MAEASVAVHLAFRWLGKPVVLFHHHVLSELQQHRPDVVADFPPGERSQRFYVHLKGHGGGVLLQPHSSLAVRFNLKNVVLG